MQPSLYEAFEVELHELAVRVESECAALENIRDAEAAAVARASLASAETLRDDVLKARNLILAAERRAEEAVEKFKKWRGLVTQCREAQHEMERLAKAMDVARTNQEHAQEKLENANAKLRDHINHPLRIEDLPTEPERQIWLNEKTKLEANVAAAVRERKAKLDIFAPLNEKWMKAARAFDRLSFQERHARCPLPQPKSLQRLAERVR